MKKINFVLVGILCMLVTSAYSNTFTIVNVGNTFSPDSITAYVGDTVVFNLGQFHNMIEVDKTTWDANGNTSNGRYTLPYHGGTIILAAAGTVFYVCEPHASLGMKGQIVVLSNGLTAVDELRASENLLKAYPNPVADLLTISFNTPDNSAVSIDLLDITGRTVQNILSAQYLSGNNTKTISISDLNPGYYFVRYTSQQRNSIVRILKPE